TQARAQKIVPLKFLFRADTAVALSHPRALAVDPLGNVYVADTGNHRIVWFSPQGKFLRYIGGLGSGTEQFDTPVDLCAPDGLNLYVADHNNSRVVQLDRKLNWVAGFRGSEFREEWGRFALPAGITASLQGDIFIAEEERSGVVKFNSFWQPVSRFGGMESGEAILDRPGQLAVVADKWLAVADVDAGRIALFDYFGNFVHFLGEKVFRQPVGLCAVPGKEEFLVADATLRQIFVVTPSGIVGELKPVSGLAETVWQIPADVAISGNRLYVADSARNALLVYQILRPQE
ncbi:MAG TPA: hypothetical protein ENJ23_02070, partial [Bacteroidetes bacterium]|nr:hypothetical protein [Bacteroidota bacterium]